MEKKGKIQKKHNCLVVRLAGNQSYVKVFDASGELIRHSETAGAAELHHIAAPGEYRIETDGTIDGIASQAVDLGNPSNQ